MLTLSHTITCNLPDAEEVLKLLETEHEEHSFIKYNDVLQAAHNIISDDIDDEAYDYFYDNIMDYSVDIVGAFWDSHPEIYE